MDKALRKQKDEPCYKWIERIGNYFGWTDEVRDVVSEIAREEYISGVNDAGKYNR